MAQRVPQTGDVCYLFGHLAQDERPFSNETCNGCDDCCRFCDVPATFTAGKWLLNLKELREIYGDYILERIIDGAAPHTREGEVLGTFTHDPPSGTWTHTAYDASGKAIIVATRLICSGPLPEASILTPPPGATCDMSGFVDDDDEETMAVFRDGHWSLTCDFAELIPQADIPRTEDEHILGVFTLDGGEWQYSREPPPGYDFELYARLP